MINKVTLIGYITKPEIHTTKSNKECVSFVLTTTKCYKDKEGKLQNTPTYHNIAVYSPNIVTYIKNYCTKGDLLYLIGSISYSKYTDKNKVERNVTTILVNENGHCVKCLKKKNSDSNNSNNTNPSIPTNNQTEPQVEVIDESGPADYTDDDEMPF